LSKSTNRHGTIVAAFGRHYEIELADGRIATGYPKGKKSLLRRRRRSPA
jgi:hypothetical protein